MSLKLGIIGLPNVGKSTLFNALSKAGAEVSNYPFTTINPNIAVVEVPDERIDLIAEISKSKKKTNTYIEFVDIAGLVKGASKGEGLGNKFLANIRETDAILHVVRCFKDENIAHVAGSPDSKRDIEIINSELLLADLETVEKKIGETRNASKTGDKKKLHDLSILEKLKAIIEKGTMLFLEKFNDEEKLLIKELQLLTAKPQLFVANVDESSIASEKEPLLLGARNLALSFNSDCISICSKLEAEVRELPESDARDYLKESGISELSLNKLIKEGYKILNLITFFTSNENETRAWMLKRGEKAPAAAGRVHSDFEKGFISAEVVHYEDLKSCGSFHSAKEKGIMRTEGKGYEVKDGDVILFRFNV